VHTTLFIKTGVQALLESLDAEFSATEIGKDRLNKGTQILDRTVGRNGLDKGTQILDRAMGRLSRSKHLRTAYALFGDYLRAAMIITELVAVRVAIALLSLPAFLFITLVAVVDGLVERDLRRFGGGMERAMLYHYVKPHARMIVVLAWVIYLSAPIGMHPNLIFVPAALLFGWVVFTTVSSFKKFL
jgi:integrating conjugative element membrane protein (TIGR03747 family)